MHRKSAKIRTSIDSDNCEDIKDENDRQNSNTKKIEDPVTHNIELIDKKIIIE